MSEQSFPPPGPPPGPPPPGAEPPGDTPTASPWSAAPGPYPGYPGYAPGPATGRPPAYGGAAHKPGAVPLQPLGLGQIYEGAFRIIRFNPRATVGGATIVSSLAMLVPLIVTIALASTVGIASEAAAAAGGGFADPDESADLAATDVVWLLSLFGGLFLSQIGTVFVTGIVCHVTAGAAVGRRLSLGEAWAETRGQRWRLVGLTLFLTLLTLGFITLGIVLVVAVAVVTGDVLVTVLAALLVAGLLVAGMLAFWIRVYYLPVPALMLERLGVFAAIGRGFRLTQHQFWRTLGIGLLTVLVTGMAAQIIGLPIGIAGQIAILAAPPGAAAVITVVMFTLTTVLGAAFTAPFTAAVTSLQYLDQRMRKEGYDVELMRKAGVFDVR